MIFGVGTDIVEIDRIAKSIDASSKFAARILSEFEYQEYAKSKHPAAYLAKKFAAKEALVKAMGTGIGHGISWQMAQIEHDDKGKPYFKVTAAIAEFFERHDVRSCHLSISDERHYASAFVVLENG